MSPDQQQSDVFSFVSGIGFDGFGVSHMRRNTSPAHKLCLREKLSSIAKRTPVIKKCHASSIHTRTHFHTHADTHALNRIYIHDTHTHNSNA